MTDTAVLHGYTEADIDRLARQAVSLQRRGLADYTLPEARDQAWEGVVALLCESEDAPTENALRRAGEMAILHDVRERRSLVGQLHARSDGYSALFEAYWQAHAMPANFEDVLVDTLGFQQAWAAMRPYHKATFEAMAMSGYRQGGAAELLGCDKRTVKRRLALGYAAFVALWFEGETPPTRARDAYDRPDQEGAGNNLNKWREEAA